MRLSARSEARAADVDYQHAGPAKQPFAIGQRVMSDMGPGVIKFIAYSQSMDEPIYTVALDMRRDMRLAGGALQPIEGKR